MKRILSLLAVFAIVFSMTVPVSAVEPLKEIYGTVELPVIDSVWTDKETYPYAIITQDSTYPGRYDLRLLSTELRFYPDGGTGALKSYASGNYVRYTYTMGSEIGWSNPFESSYTKTTSHGNNADLLWTSSDILNQNTGAVEFEYIEPIPVVVITPECDGSSCPATDLNHDNICDDCGWVLTMSLRSTLWEYAQSVVANGVDIFDSDYWVITDNGSNGYRIYISKLPFNYIEGTGLVGTDLVQRTEVYDTSDGSYIGGTSWASKQPNTALDVGTPVATSHPIEGFFPIPLWMEMDRLTQGEMTEMSQTMGGMMKILVPCGVGCLVLLAVLKLFWKRSLIFRN